MRQVIIYADHEDGGFVCEVPSLPGCVSQGDTREEALENARDAIEAWVDAAHTLGKHVPEVEEVGLNDPVGCECPKQR